MSASQSRNRRMTVRSDKSTRVRMSTERELCVEDWLIELCRYCNLCVSTSKNLKGKPTDLLKGRITVCEYCSDIVVDVSDKNQC